MCTAAAFVTKDFYFGRTLDYEMSYGDEAVIVPRNFCISFPNIEKKISMHPAYIGMAHVDDNYPLRACLVSRRAHIAQRIFRQTTANFRRNTVCISRKFA